VPGSGLLALISEAYSDAKPNPLLGAEIVDQIGCVLELELDNEMPEQSTGAGLTRVLVDACDPAFSAPSKFIGPVYSKSEARSLTRLLSWTASLTVGPGGAWSRRLSLSGSGSLTPIEHP